MSLAGLAKLLDALDLNKDKNHVLRNISYGLTFNESLGFNIKDAADFYVGQPYTSWPEDLNKAPTNFESPLAIAFKDVIETGLAASRTNNGKVFIDIASLAGEWPGFFLNTYTKALGINENLAQAFGRMVRDNIAKDATPVIRVLLGQRGKEKNATSTWQNQLQEEFKQLFWPDNKCILHSKAEVYIGFYSPSFDAA